MHSGNLLAARVLLNNFSQIFKIRVMHDYNGNFYGMHFFWWIFIIIIILIVIFIIGKQAKIVKRKTPLEILKKRFAKGEITKEEFEKSKDILNN